MPMFTICCQIISEGKLNKELNNLAEAEKKFSRKIGVLERDFYQCIDQPHIIWAKTKWTSEKAHNAAAESIMKVRKDDRVASAYFQPGLYLEVFCKELHTATCVRNPGTAAELVVICHGLIATKRIDAWYDRITMTEETLTTKSGLLRSRTFYNYYNRAHFIGFMEWINREAYENDRMVEQATVEEFTFVGGLTSELAAYNQYYCRPLGIG